MRLPVIWPTTKNRGVFLSAWILLPFLPMLMLWAISTYPPISLLIMLLDWLP